jgi:glycosyltransferase involved in cell wall biosynthesis
MLELLSTTLASIRPSLRVLRESRADTVIVNTVTPPLWLVLARLSGRFTVRHVHEGEASVPGVLRRALYLPLLFAQRILINSRFSLDVLETAAPWLRARTRIVYNAVAGPPAVVPPRPRLDGATRLLFVGRLSHRKGPHVAVDAVGLLADAGVDVHLSLLGAVFPGNEAYAEQLEQQIDGGLRARVDMLGFRPSVWEELAAADVILIPSTLDEPFGNTAVEAALSARPSVVSAVGGLPEAAGHSTSTVLVPPGDASALAGAVRTIIDEWAEYAARASVDAVEVARAFSADRYAREILTGIARPPRRRRR